MENEKVTLVRNGVERVFEIKHALEVLRTDKKKEFKPVGKHKFVNNELIIETSFGDGEKPTKPTASKKGKGVSERTADTD
tara:strand:- start:890 stop:1129 length:240 start_codon:yes stop_codon:yes gene_type:complete